MKAFPNLGSNSPDHNDYDGMNLRDYFAAKATEKDVQYYIKLTSVPIHAIGAHGQYEPQITREQAKYMYADAMMEAREESP